MARQHSPNSTQRPDRTGGDRINFADLLSGWLLLGVGLVMIAFLWLMPAHLEGQQLARERDALRHHLAQMRVANEDQQNLLTALENHDPVLIERLACHYLGLRPVGVQGRSEARTSDHQLALNGSGANIVPTRVADLPRRANWQDVVNETTSLRLSTIPPLPKAPDLPDTQLIALTTTDKRFFVLALAGLCLFAGIRSGARVESEGDVAQKPRRKRKSQPRVARSEWTQAFEATPVEALAVAGVGAGMASRFADDEAGTALLDASDELDAEDWAVEEDYTGNEAEEAIETAAAAEHDVVGKEAAADEVTIDGDWADTSEDARIDDQPGEPDAATIDATAEELAGDWDAQVEADGDWELQAGALADDVDEIEPDADTDEADWDDEALDLIADGDGFDAVSTSDDFEADDDSLFAPPSV